MPEPVKIQLNSEEAVRRLIGTDTDLEVEIKSRILDTLAEHVLKFKMPDLTAQFKGLEKEVRDRMDKAAEEVADKMLTSPNPHASTWGNTQGKKILAETTKTLIERRVKELVDETITKQFNAYCASTEKAVLDRFTEHKASLEVYLNRLVHREVAIQVKAALESYLTELTRATLLLKLHNDATPLEQLRPLSLGED